MPRRAASVLASALAADSRPRRARPSCRLNVYVTASPTTSGGRGGRGRGWVGLEVEQAEREPHATDAVGDRVVDPLEERGAPALEPFDHGELPEGPRPVKGCGRRRRGQVEKLPHPARRRRRDPTEVVVEVEVVVGLPLGGSEAERCRHDTVTETWDVYEGLLELRPHPGDVGGVLEDADVREVRAEGGVLLDRPHDRFGIAHPHWLRVSRRR